MKNELKVFRNQEFGNVRVIIVNDKEMFVASDVAKALGYAKPNNAISAHCKNATLKQGIIDSMGREQIATLIGEGDVYRLIMKSKLPSAEKFEKWVMEEVLPSIRNHGAYMTESTIEKALTSPDFLIQLATKLKEEQEARRLAESKLEDAKPMIEFAETVEASEGSIDMKAMAKLCNGNNISIGRNRLFEFLREEKVLMKDNTPYQRYVDNEWFEVVESVKFGRLYTTTLVLPKGQIGIVNLLNKKY